MLAWLLNPNEKHRLGDSFLEVIIQIVAQNDDDDQYTRL